MVKKKDITKKTKDLSKETIKEVTKDIPLLKYLTKAHDNIKEKELFNKHDKLMRSKLNKILDSLENGEFQKEEGTIPKYIKNMDEDFCKYFYLLKSSHEFFINKGYDPIIKIEDWIEINKLSQYKYSDLDYNKLVEFFQNKALFFRKVHELNELMKKYMADVVYTQKNYIEINNSKISKCSFMFINSDYSFSYWYNINEFYFDLKNRELFRKIFDNKPLDIELEEIDKDVDGFFMDFIGFTEELFQHQVSLKERKEFYSYYLNERASEYKISEKYAFKGVIFPQNFVKDVYSGKIFQEYNLEYDEEIFGSEYCKLFQKFAIVFLTNDIRYFDLNKFINNIETQMSSWQIPTNFEIYDFLMKIHKEKDIPNNFSNIIYFFANMFNELIYTFTIKSPNSNFFLIKSNFDMEEQEGKKLIEAYLTKID
ncbi:MAG: hypothetical protein HPY60_05095 [Candidatus Methanofastidiosum sp.]|nr:hypothetical protein [Methanofastidiosum sp.]